MSFHTQRPSASALALSVFAVATLVSANVVAQSSADGALQSSIDQSLSQNPGAQRGMECAQASAAQMSIRVAGAPGDPSPGTQGTNNEAYTFYEPVIDGESGLIHDVKPHIRIGAAEAQPGEKLARIVVHEATHATVTPAIVRDIAFAYVDAGATASVANDVIGQLLHTTTTPGTPLYSNDELYATAAGLVAVGHPVSEALQKFNYTDELAKRTYGKDISSVTLEDIRNLYQKQLRSYLGLPGLKILPSCVECGSENPPEECGKESAQEDEETCGDDPLACLADFYCEDPDSLECICGDMDIVDCLCPGGDLLSCFGEGGGFGENSPPG